MEGRGFRHLPLSASSSLKILPAVLTNLPNSLPECLLYTQFSSHLSEKRREKKVHKFQFQKARQFLGVSISKRVSLSFYAEPAIFGWFQAFFWNSPSKNFSSKNTSQLITLKADISNIRAYFISSLLK